MIQPPGYETRGVFENVLTYEGYLWVKRVNSCLV